MSDFFIDMDFSEMVEFSKIVARVGGMQQKYVIQAAKAGQAYAFERVVAAAPRGKTGNLAANIVSVGERSRRKGRKIYDTKFKGGDAVNAVLSKPIKRPGIAGGQNKKGYYPASVEYGFLTRANQGGGLKFVRRATGVGLKRVEGQHFMRDTAEVARPQVEKIMIDTLMARLNREWKRQCRKKKS